MAGMLSKNFYAMLWDRLMVGHQPLELGILVRIQVPQLCAEIKIWRGEVGHQPLKPSIGVRLPARQPSENR